MMHDEHITEPLDYLYEELPPERMAEVRKHLAQCGECRTAMRDIRETVKLYRQLPHPPPPPGLARRATAAAIAVADQGATGLVRGRLPAAAAVAASLDRIVAEEAPPPPEVRQARLEEEFAQLKNEVKGEMRRGWRQWFFHPAWTVAASVVFVCALIIHFSPRYRHEPVVYMRQNVPLEGAAKTIRDRERIPVPHPRAAVPLGDDPLVPPVLQQAKARQDLPLPSLAAAPRVPQPAAASGTAEPADVAMASGPAANTPVHSMPVTPFGAPAVVELAEAPVSAAAPAPVAPLAARTDQAPDMAVGNLPQSATMPPPDAEKHYSGRAAAVQTAVTAQEPEQKHASVSPPRPPAAPVPGPASASVAIASPKQAERESAVPATTAGTTTASVPESGDEAPPPPSADAPVPDAAEIAALAAVQVDDDAVPVIVYDMLAGMEPPQIVERPEGFSVAERVHSLTTLAGMQIANGEIEDAWATVAMLRRYDENAAENVSALLREAEKAALAAAEAASEEVIPETGQPSPALPETVEPDDQRIEPPASKYDPFISEPTTEAVDQPLTVSATEPDTTGVDGAAVAVASGGAVIAEVVSGWVEPPDDPPPAAVSVGGGFAFDTGAYSIDSVPVFPEQNEIRDLRQNLDPSRSAELAQTLSRALGGEASRTPHASQADAASVSGQANVIQRAIPLHVYIQPTSPAPASPPRKRFTTDPYLRER